MAEFLVELYVPGDDRAAAQQQTVRAERAAAGLAHDGSPVRCLWSVFVPEDETCLLLYDAPSAETVRAALDAADLAWEHVSAAATCSTPHSQTSACRPAGRIQQQHPKGTTMTSTAQPETTSGAPSALEQLKVGQQKIWSSGDYGRIAWLTVPLARELVEAVDVRPGSRVLDVATGTGHVAIEAARSFCEVTGIDYVPALIEVARRRAQAEDLSIDFQVGDAEALAFDDDTFDAVLSAIGVMFTADHPRAAGELVRVARPGGRIGLASWTPTGFVGQMLKTVGAHVTPPPAAKPATRWGSEDVVRELLGDGVRDVSAQSRTVRQRFLSAEHFADFFLTHYGPTHMAASKLDDAGRSALRADLVDLGQRFNEATDGGVVVGWEYLVVTATKR